MEAWPADTETRQKHAGPHAASASSDSGCEVCRQLSEAHDRYLARLRRDGRMRRGLTQALVSSMGFCPGHEQLLRSDPELRDWVGLRIDEARKGFALLLGRARLQDEVLQEIVFGARNHCPACLYCRRLAGHQLSRKLRDIQSGRARASALLSGQLCFEHARQLVQRCDSGALNSRLLRALRRKGKTAAAPARKRPRGSLRWFDPPRPGTQASAGHAAAQDAPRPEEEGGDSSSYLQLRCPGCQAMDIAVRRAVASWLYTFARAAANQRVGMMRQLCLKHLAEALIYAPNAEVRAGLIFSQLLS